MKTKLALGLITLAPIIAGPANSTEWQIAIQSGISTQNGAIEQEVWDFFIEHVQPGDRYQVIKAASGELIAEIEVPDDERMKRSRRKVKKFSRELSAINQTLMQHETADSPVNMSKLLRAVGNNRLNADDQIELLIVGDLTYASAKEPHFSMWSSSGQFRIPSDTHITARVQETPYGLAGREDSLSGVYIHACHIPAKSDWSSNFDNALHRFLSLSTNHQGGDLVTWSAQIKQCVKRFSTKARNKSETYEISVKDKKLKMINVVREDIENNSNQRLSKAGVKSFNLFTRTAHPTLSSVTVVTGVEYLADNYPSKYDHSWCYFNVTKGGADIRIDVGTKHYGGQESWSLITSGSLNAAGISRSDVTGARSACDFPKG